MPRRSTPDAAIGQRIRDRRKLLKLTVRVVADLAGIHHSTLSRIERGEISADNRFTLASIAQGLRCPVTDLTGQPAAPVDHGDAQVSGSVYETLRAVIEADLQYRPAQADALPITALTHELDLIRDLRARCDYAGATTRIPSLLRGLHLAAYGSERAEALRALVIAEDTASFVVRYAGNPAAACLVADRAQQAAEALDQPVMLGLAAFARSHAATGCGLYERALTIADHAARDLEAHTNLPDGREMLGQLYMTQAYALYALGRAEDAMEPVALAERIAADTGDSDALRLMFGPTNINFWRIAMEADGDSPGRAVEIARGTTPHAVDSISRQFAFYSDTGRALARTGRDAEALRMLLAADRLAPQRMRNPIMVETVRSLLERSRRGTGWTELRGLCERLGIGS
ncbi:helix-turn-helix domain-containing protein [Micromonospora sp. NBC_01796]|uniref:helix-turn-helix domain-containing protein n=1 Tax=Micromonospora sp. NBC_01796 TaxID=2975987 RepID=UPI002DD868B9|nr:helix-turn-helix transcriptional regulator [Micromonospora sp. NBC_01796]WSA85289.1 helix-turn-helix domain-containing protein [Micromonospora sp. NBC_01796]